MTEETPKHLSLAGGSKLQLFVYLSEILRAGSWVVFRAKYNCNNTIGHSTHKIEDNMGRRVQIMKSWQMVACYDMKQITLWCH